MNSYMIDDIIKKYWPNYGEYAGLGTVAAFADMTDRLDITEPDLLAACRALCLKVKPWEAVAALNTALVDEHNDRVAREEKEPTRARREAAKEGVST